jgi:hypothetical protein
MVQEELIRNSYSKELIKERMRFGVAAWFVLWPHSLYISLVNMISKKKKKKERKKGKKE